jgi:hypothetical protein
VPQVEREEVRAIFAAYGLWGEPLAAAVNAVASDKSAWVRFMMREELGVISTLKPQAASTPVAMSTLMLSAQWRNAVTGRRALGLR